MENQIITTEFQQATDLHSRIMANAEVAAGALLEMCKNLKEMRDSKLYLQFGIDTFENYCEKKVGIKSRQAYTYISTYEKLGSTVLQSNANLGITKLELIAQLPAPDRANELADGTFEGMSVKEIKELVKKSKEQGEQLSLLMEEKEEIQNSANEFEDKYLTLLSETTTQSLESNNKILELNKKIKELENKPTEVVISKPSDEDIERLRNEIRLELEAEAKATVDENTITQTDIDKAVAKAIEEEKAKTKSKASKQLEKLEAEREKAITQAEAAENKLAELQKQLQLADPAKSKAVMYFDAVQSNYNNMINAIEEMVTEEDKNNFRTAVKRALEALADNLADNLKE